MVDDKLCTPLPAQKNNVIRLFPAAPEPDDKNEMVLYMEDDEQCCICSKLQQDQDQSFLVLASVDGEIQQFYCTANCLYVHLNSLVNSQ